MTGVLRRWDFWLCLIAAVLGALIAPLDDPDLPMHLLTGDWILDHGQLPTIEPFAWTRAGASFIAYSWLPEVLYAVGWRALGSLGVSLVHATIAGASAWAIWWLARTQQWTVWSARIVAAVHILLWSQVQPAARPQLLLAVAVPLAWGSATLFRRHVVAERTDGLPAIPLLVATISGMIAVNSHLLFPLTLAPVVWVLASTPIRRAWVWVAAMLFGWMLTPNAAHLVSAFVLNFSPNALFGAASPILEHESGFAYLTHTSLGTQLLVLALLMLPLTRPVAQSRTRERVWMGLSWMTGLVLFGLAVRGLLLWWLLALPWMAMACSAIPLPRSSRIARATLLAWCIVVTSAVLHAAQSARRAADIEGLPHPYARELAPIVEVLECAVSDRQERRGVESATRGITNFDYGSYLAWRIPQISWSIDGRTIFPDSVARAEARQQLREGSPVHQPWRAGDVVAFSSGHATLGLIRADSAWMPILSDAQATPGTIELWVRRAWWTREVGSSNCAALAGRVEP
ncbi:MAG: hypothetical protein IBJ03_17640 [Gemmatimonadaceae bacterium]|nr:hypothetical protein [Gemmatimonadaceae bacterium]